MIVMVTRKVYLRPIMSPRRPNTSAPNGRTAKPAAKPNSTKMNFAVSFVPGHEVLADVRGERAGEVKVVPLENGAGGGGDDDLPLFGRHRTGCVVRPWRRGSGCHECFLPDVQLVPDLIGLSQHYGNKIALHTEI